MRMCTPPTLLSRLLLPLVLVLALFSPSRLPAQAGDSALVAQVLHNLRERFNRIEDYQVDLRVSLELPMLRMPRKKMTFTFKQPDKVRLEAKTFAMVPRRGVALSPDSLLQGLRNLAVAGDTLMDEHPCLILRGLETGPDNLSLMAEVLVDRELWVVRGIATVLEGNDVFRLRIKYIEVAPGIHMPEETHLRFQLSEHFLRGRHGRGGAFDPDVPEPVLEEGEEIVGEASIIFTNYRVNHGIPDSYFEEEKTPSD